MNSHSTITLMVIASWLITLIAFLNAIQNPNGGEYLPVFVFPLIVKTIIVILVIADI